MVLKMIGVDSTFKAPKMIDQPVIQASDFRGEAFGVLARAQQANLEAQKNQIINQASTDLAIQGMNQQAAYSYRGGGSIDSQYMGGAASGSGGSTTSRGGSGEGFNPQLDVSAREKFEYEKQKDAAQLQLNVAKFQHDSGMEERKFGLDVEKFKSGREDEYFSRDLRTQQFGLDVAKFDYTQAKDQQEWNDKIQERFKKEFQSQQFAMAQQDVQELVLASEGLMRKGGGMEAIRGGLSDIFKKYPGIAPEQQAAIIQTVYTNPQRITREQIEKTEKKIDEVQQFQRNTVLQAKRLEIQSLTAGLKTATGSRRQQLIGSLQKQLDGFANSNADPLTKAMVLSGLYTEVANKGEVGADVQQKLADYANYSREASQLYLKRNSMSPSQYSLQESLLQQKYGVTGFRLDNTNFDNQKALDTLKTTTDLKDLRIKGDLDSRFGLNASRAAIAELAKANADPSRIAALKAYAERYGRPPGLMQAIQLAEDTYNHRKSTTDVQMKLSNLDKEAAMMQSADAKTVLDMIEGGQQNNTNQLITTAMLANANPKLAAALQQGGKIPPEVRADIMKNWSQYRRQAVNEIENQKRILNTQYQMEREYLSSYYSKDNFAALDAIRQQQSQGRLPSGGFSIPGMGGVGVNRGAAGQQSGVNPALLQQAAGTMLNTQLGAMTQLGGSRAPQVRQQPQNANEWAKKQMQKLGGGNTNYLQQRGTFQPLDYEAAARQAAQGQNIESTIDVPYINIQR